jgi:hypothetical protein
VALRWWLYSLAQIETRLLFSLKEAINLVCHANFTSSISLNQIWRATFQNKRQGQSIAPLASLLLGIFEE